MTKSLPAEIPEVTVTQDGKLVLTEEQLAAVIRSHVRLIVGLEGVDNAMLAKAEDGDTKAAWLIYQRLGLLRGKAQVNKPEVPDIATHELQAELARRGKLREAEVVREGDE